MTKATPLKSPKKIRNVVEASQTRRSFSAPVGRISLKGNTDI